MQKNNRATVESLTVVFPVYNEKEYLRGTVEKAVRILEELTSDYEIIIVDDASDDGTGEIAEMLSHKNPRIKVIHHTANRKLGGTLKNGFKHATKKFVLYSDIDMPFDFAEIKRAVDVALGRDAGLVSVYRLNRMEDGLRRYIYSVAYNFFIRMLFGVRIKDINFSFKLIRNDILQRLALSSEGSFIDAEMLIKAHYYNTKIIQFGTRYFPRLKGSSRLSSVSVILKILQEAFAFRFRLSPYRAQDRS